MAHGFYCLNDAFALQFDDEHPAMSLRAKGGFSASDPGYYVDYNDAQTPLIAFRPIGCNVAVEQIRKSGSRWEYYFNVYQSSPGFYFNWWIFDQPPPVPSTTGWGMTIQDDAGKCVLDLNYPPMRLVEGSQPSGRVYAIAPAPGPGYREQSEAILDSFGNATGGLFWRTAIGGWEFNGSDFYVQTYDTDTHFYGSDIAGTPDYGVLVDVTGY